MSYRYGLVESFGTVWVALPLSAREPRRQGLAVETVRVRVFVQSQLHKR